MAASAERITLAAGQVDWDELTDRIHRAVSVGEAPYEEITVFLDRPDALPQPQPDDSDRRPLTAPDGSPFAIGRPAWGQRQ